MKSGRWSFYCHKGAISSKKCVAKRRRRDRRGKPGQRYERDQRLLKRLDDVNNALCGSDATTNIEVEGNRLSVATARMYLREINFDNPNTEPVFDGKGMGIVHYGENMRGNFLENCIDREAPMFMGERRRLDPVGLRDRQEEFERKRIDWEMGLKKAIAISDATTEVVFPA